MFENMFKLSGNANFVKYILIGLNILFILTAIIILTVGLLVKDVYNEYRLLLGSQFFAIPILLFVICGIILGITVFGFYAAYKENPFLLLIFTILLSIVFILELAAGISGYVLRSDTISLIDEQMNTTMSLYNHAKHEDVTILWDKIQQSYQCCGLESYNDWIKKINALPVSCCFLPPGSVNAIYCSITNTTYLYKDGCIHKFSPFIMKYAVILGGVGIGIATVQLVGILFSFYIVQYIKRNRGGY